MKRPTGTDTYCWRPEEVEAILERCREVAELNWLGNALTVLSRTGMRISEQASLRWSDIDLQNKMIRLTDERTSPTRGRVRKARQIKNGSGRSFPIHESLRELLERIPRHADGLVFHGPRGGALSPDIARRTLMRDVLKPLAARFPTAKDEVGFADGRLHSFRHYFCSYCANNGVAEQLLMRWLGHHDSQMIRHYYHLHDDEAQRQMQRLSFVGGAAAKITSRMFCKCQQRQLGRV